MASAVAKLTVKTSAIIAQRSGVGVAVGRSVRFASSSSQSSGIRGHKSRSLLTFVGGSAVSLAALAAFIKLRSMENPVNAVSLKRRMVMEKRGNREKR